MAPDIPKIDPDRHLNLGNAAWNFRDDEVLRWLFHGNSLSDSKDLLIPFIGKFDPVVSQNAVLRESRFERSLVAMPQTLVQANGATRRFAVKSRIILVIAVLSLAVSQASARERPRYLFVLPEGYVGWVQIIFNDPQAPPLRTRKEKVIVEVPESGIVRTSALRVHSSLAPDEFYYEKASSFESLQKHLVPSSYVVPGIDHAGFGVMDTGGKGKGYSWFIFFGPPELRASVPLADWDKVVEDHRKLYGNSRVSAPDPYPIPGRMERFHDVPQK
jgi:hypothetical protein